MQLNKAVLVIGFSFIFIHKMKIDSAAVCGFLFQDPVGHAQDMLLLSLQSDTEYSVIVM